MWKKWNKKYKASFTLQELIVVVAVIGIITAASITSLNDTKSGNAVIGAQREIVSSVKLAQNYALQGKTQVRGGSSEVPCGYGFVIKSETLYAIFYNFLQSGFSDCESQNTNTGYSKYISTSVTTNDMHTLLGGVKFNAGDVDKAFYFSVPMGETHGTSGAVLSSPVNIVVSMGSKSKTVTIGPGGVIDEAN